MNVTSEIISDIRQALTESIDPKALASSARFFKEGEAAKVYGVRNAEVNKMAKESFRHVKDCS